MNTFKRQSGLGWGIIVLFGLAALSSGNIHAQTSGEPPQPRVRHTLRPLQISGGKIISDNALAEGDHSMDATLSNVVNYLESKDPTANILLPADLGQIKIGDLQLSDAPTDLALQAASVASGNQFQIDERRSIAGMILLVIEKSQKPYPPPSDVTVQAFSVNGYLSYLKFDMLSRQVLNMSGPVANVDEMRTKLDECLNNLKSIIIQTLDLEQDYKNIPIRKQAPLINFYKDADLLIVVGSPHAVETAGKIISALPGQNGGRLVDANGTTTLPVDLQNNGAAASGHAGSRAATSSTSQP